MLSPSVNTTLGLLTRALNEVLQLDQYALTSNNILIGQLQEDPDWLAQVRSRVAMLGQAGSGWISAKPTIWSGILLPFINYASTFGGLAATQFNPGVSSATQWSALLKQVLLTQIDEAIAGTQSAAEALAEHRQAFADIQPLLSQSIDAGWAELADEEQQMTQIAAELQRLQDLVNSLQDSITSNDISTGQSIVTTTVKTIYNIATEVGESFSFMGMLASAVTVGKFFYDVISKTEEVSATLQQIATLQVQASDEAQAAAGTKMVLQMLYDLELRFASMADVLPQINMLWQGERSKVQAAIDALDAGADPSTYFDLLTLKTANANWQSIGRFTNALPNLLTHAGPAVTLNPQDPSSLQAATSTSATTSATTTLRSIQHG
jgi:hypothetical protein